MKDLDAIMMMMMIIIIIVFVIIVIIIIIILLIMMFSGNSSECRLEVSAATLADHGTWTCSLSQDKVAVEMMIMIMVIRSDDH